jgi:hypothetical protein
MITNEELNILRTESLLSGSFVILKDSSGDKYVMFGESLVDINTFKLMMVWKSFGGVIYKRIINNREAHRAYLIDLNKHDKLLASRHSHNIVEYLYSKFIAATSTDTISDIMERYRNQIID